MNLREEGLAVAVDAQKAHIVAALSSLATGTTGVSNVLSDTFDDLAHAKDGMSNQQNAFVQAEALKQLGFINAVNEID